MRSVYKKDAYIHGADGVRSRMMLYMAGMHEVYMICGTTLGFDYTTFLSDWRLIVLGEGSEDPRTSNVYESCMGGSVIYHRLVFALISISLAYGVLYIRYILQSSIILRRSSYFLYL